MSTLALIFLLGMATARATRGWRDDKITEGARDRVADLLESQGRLPAFRVWVLDMLECPWCLSGWLAGAAVIFVDSATSRSVDLPVLAWLVVWYIANVGYWGLEALADADALLWHEREEKDLT